MSDGPGDADGDLRGDRRGVEHLAESFPHAHLPPEPHTFDRFEDHSPWMDHEHLHYGLPGRDLSPRARLMALADGVLHAIRRHWLAGINTLLVTMIGLAVLAPFGYAAGLTGASDAVFHAFRFLCGQTPSHSFYIFGYQMCLCTRCLAIYSALLTGGILLAFLRQSRRIRPLSWKLWALAMVPMALDGGTQLFGLRESNLGLRLLTGVIFGLATAWFLFPQIEDASRDALAVQPASN